LQLATGNGHDAEIKSKGQIFIEISIFLLF